ncbi:MAG TPA: lipo-like protein [Rhodocyclaceae bacterium]|nr:lipo-like protein [Rhodocyclaceae bacterium]
MLHLPRFFGRLLARYLSKQRPGSRVGMPTDQIRLAKCLKPGDVLLVEGCSRVSTVTKYLTQSTWSHATLYVGPSLGGRTEEGESYLFVEADLVLGVCKRPLSHYADFHTRICRPKNLTPEDMQQVLNEVVGKIGNQYDLKNLIDMARYLFPLWPVPARWRRKLIAFGSGDPTKAICSSLIAEAFQNVGYPILPVVRQDRMVNAAQQEAVEEIYEIRHQSLYAPRDFDVSPYFEVIKPTLEVGFDYRNIHWQKAA